MNKIAEIFGNGIAIGSATLATITQDDLRLWLVALIGILITASTAIPRYKRERYSAMKERIDLCRECKSPPPACPDSCTVSYKHRPKDCPIKDKK